LNGLLAFVADGIGFIENRSNAFLLG